MADRLYHRGPDDGGAWVDEAAGIALGHRRLSILDLSPAGHQPMVSPSGRYVIAFNGEVYNHLALRRDLENIPSPQPLSQGARGHVSWRGHSDTETLLGSLNRLFANRKAGYINLRQPNVLFLTKCARNGASSRYRTFQYLPWLEQLLPYFPPLLERALRWLRVPYVADYDDALFHQYDQHRSGWMRRLLGGKIARVMRGAHLVTAGNAYLADDARRAGAPRVEIIPTVIDLERYPPAGVKPASDTPFTIGWINSPSTAKYLQAIAPALADVCADGKGRVRLIGSGPVDLPGVPVEVLPWNEATEVDELKRLDVGIMPLPDGPWARGKCGFKLIQYMACGLPVVASPVGVNSEIVEQGVNGYLAGTTAEWVQALNALLLDGDLRKRMGQAGRKKVGQEYSLQVTGPKLAGLIKAVVGAGKIEAWQ
jgi:glycosyltransferase involved in cell wall biosynthesis